MEEIVYIENDEETIGSYSSSNFLDEVGSEISTDFIDTRESNSLSIDQLYTCSVCEKNYETSLGLRHHIVKSYGKEILLYECEKCVGNFRIKNSYKSHKCIKNKKIELKIQTENEIQNEEIVQSLNNVKNNKNERFNVFDLPVEYNIRVKGKPYLGNIISPKNNTEIENQLIDLEIDIPSENIIGIASLKNSINSDIISNDMHCRAKFGLDISKINRNEKGESLIKNTLIDYAVIKKCNSKNLKEKIDLVKQEYMETLKVLKLAKKNSEKLKKTLRDLGENVNYSISELDSYEDFLYLETEDEEGENSIDIERKPSKGKGDDEKSPRETLSLLDKIETNELESYYSKNSAVKREKSNNFVYENYKQANNNKFWTENSNCFETFNQGFHQSDENNIINDNDNYNKEASELIDESQLKAEFLIETTLKGENFLNIDFMEDSISNNNYSSVDEELYDIEYIDEFLSEERADTDNNVNILSSKRSDSDKYDQVNNFGSKEEIYDISLKGKYNEKFMSFLYKSLMKEELQKDKIQKDLKRQQKKINKLSEIQNENQKFINYRQEETTENNKTNNLSEIKITRKSDIEKSLEIENKKKIKYSCSYCDKTFVNKSILDTHLRSHTGERPYKCSYCERRCYDRASLDIHHRRHTNDRRYKCEFCIEKFFTLFEKKRHQITWHQNNPKKKLENVSSLRHSMSYDQKRKFGPKALLMEDGLYHCKMCDKICLTAKTMRKHTALHLNGKACPLCSKVFAYESTLQRHLRVPHEEKNFMCTFCGNRYASTGSLKSHLKVHSAGATKCPLCPKIFGTLYNFDRHMLHKHKLKNWRETYINTPLRTTDSSFA